MCDHSAVDTLELFAHPVRLRIVHALAGGRVLTTAELCERVPGVHKATVYRHVGVLAEHGVLEVEGERRVRGAVERGYRLRRDRAVVDGSAATAQDHRRAFAASMAALIAEFDAYLDLDGADPVADSVGYRQHALWLSEDERAEMIAGMRAAIAPHLGNEASPDRARHLLSPILFPVE